LLKKCPILVNRLNLRFRRFFFFAGIKPLKNFFHGSKRILERFFGSFNRTIVELKPGCKYFIFAISIVLIEPLWN